MSDCARVVFGAGKSLCCEGSEIVVIRGSEEQDVRVPTGQCTADERSVPDCPVSR